MCNYVNSAMTTRHVQIELMPTLLVTWRSK